MARSTLSTPHNPSARYRMALRTAAAESIATALDEPVADWDAHLRPTTCQAHRLEVPVVADPLAVLEDLPRITKPEPKPKPRKAGAA